MKKIFLFLAFTFFTVVFAQNTRATLEKTIDDLYSDIDKKCSKDFDLLNDKYMAIAEKSPDKTLSKTDKAEYDKQFNVLQNPYNECLNKSQSQKIEKLKSLLEKVEIENKAVSEVKNNTPSPAAQPFSVNVLHNELIKVFSGNDLFQDLDSSLTLTFTFTLCKDGIIRDIKVMGTDNEEIKLFSVLNFYSIKKVFLPVMSNGVPVNKRYRLPLTFAMGI